MSNENRLYIGRWENIFCFNTCIFLHNLYRTGILADFNSTCLKIPEKTLGSAPKLRVVRATGNTGIFLFFWP